MDFLSKFPFLQRIFGSGGAPREETRQAARDRLRLVLVSDRSTVAPHLMESLRNDLIEVLSRYMEIDTRTMQMGLERHEGAMALAANIPVRSIHRSSAEMPAVRAEPQAPVAVLEPPPRAEDSVERAVRKRSGRRRHRRHSRSGERSVE